MAGVVGIALATVLVHLLEGWRYGFDRDELLALEDARHLAWGYVQYPPMTAFFGWVALKLFGTSLGGFRFFAALVQAVALVLTGMMAKEMARRSETRNAKFEIRDADVGILNEVAGRSTEILRVQTTHPQDDKAFLIAGESKNGRWRETGDWAALVAALAGVPFCLGAGALMQYISFDYVCWAIVAWGMVKLVTADVASGQCRVASADEHEIRDTKFEKPNAENLNPAAGFGGERWWVVVGMGIGLGMLAKYTMGLLVAGVVVGVLATPLRRHLRSGWLWMGVVLSLIIFLPNFLWEWRHGFVSVDFLRFLHERDVREGVTDGFLLGQLRVTMLAAPLAAAGLWFYFAGGRWKNGMEGKDHTEQGFEKRKPQDRPSKSEGGAPKESATDGAMYRVLGWMYVVPLVLLVVLQGRDYYLAPAYPMLYAAGAVWVEQKSRKAEEWKSGRGWQRVRTVLIAALLVDVVVAGAVALPIAPVNSRWWKLAAKVDPVFPEEIGWEEFTESVADVWQRLPATEQAQAAILAGNYGEIGALNLYGERLGLPRAISGVNSSWERGFGAYVPETLVVVGYPRELLEKYFASCQVGGRVWNKYGVANEESIEDPEIFVCRGLHGKWEEFWRAVRKFA
jgi:4-amino-4-deoxy-L-arabinose transferase-like glycosyltransferase